MVQSLDKKWKELLFAFSGFGPNLLMVLMGAYFTDAINPAALGQGNSFQAILSGTCFILPAVFPILYAIAKAFDGVIDIPFAHITDTLSTKWGRRRPAILVCMIPMILSFAMCWFPVFGAEDQLGNTIWITAWSLVFFATYTMCLIAFYGSLSTTCTSEPQRLRVSGYKSFFDTISYCIVYALVPVLLDAFSVHIDKFVFICLPLMLTISIPLFLIKEGEKYGYPENRGVAPKRVTFIESLKLTFKNKLFMRWVVIHCFTYIGLQMFLVAMNAMMIGGMGMDGLGMAILNTTAFAPVPIMLYLFNKVKAKKGVRFTYQSCLLSFGVAIMSFFLASKYVVGDNNQPLQFVIGSIGGICASWSIGAFFMLPLLIPSQISSVEEQLTGKNHSAMYFAAQARISSIVSAISGSFIYEMIKMLFISKDASGVVWAESFEQAAQMFGVSASRVYNLGSMLVPFIVSAACIIGFFWAFKLPKDFDHKSIALELKKHDPNLDISEFIANSDNEKEEKGEIIFVQVGLSVLSGFIFGFIWLSFLLKSVKELTGKLNRLLYWALSCFVPFASIYFTLKIHSRLQQKAEELGIKLKGSKVLYIILGVLFPILPINVIALAFLQKDINALYVKDKAFYTEAIN